MYEHMVLKCLSMDSGICRRHDSGLPRSMCRASMLQARDGFKRVQASASRLSSTSMEFLVGPRLQFALTSLLILSVVACTMRWGYLFVSLCSFMRSTIVLFLCTILGRSREDCRYSASFQRDCASASQLCGMTLEPKTEPICMQSFCPTEHAWAAVTCGCSLMCCNAPEMSSSKSKNSLEGHDIRTLHA